MGGNSDDGTSNLVEQIGRPVAGADVHQRGRARAGHLAGSGSGQMVHEELGHHQQRLARSISRGRARPAGRPC